MRRASAIFVAVCVLGGCGGESDETSDATASKRSAFFVRGEKLDPVTRPGQTPSAVMRALLAGPTAAERAQGIATAIPEGTTLRDLFIADALATVDLSGSFDDGGGSLSMQLRVAQVVYTLTQFPAVERVRFAIDGSSVAAIGGEGVVVDPPVDREDFRAFE